MKSFSDDLFYTTVRLEGITNDGSSVGTGFYYSYGDRYYIVTNKHVINGVKDGFFIINKGVGEGNEWTPILGKGFKVNFNENSFLGHPNPEIDVAVMNITYFINKIEAQNDKPFFMSIDNNIIPNSDDIENLISGIEDIIFIGYPSGIWDSKNLLPIIRKGITSTPYYFNFMNEPKFLIDASVFPGSSGSPVFIYNSGFHKNRRGSVIYKSKLFFLGIIAQTYHRQEEGKIIIKNIPTRETNIPINKQMIDLGVVFKASTIVESIEYYNQFHK